MKALRNIIDKIKPDFMPGGKFEKLHTAFDAFETLLFVPAHTTSKGVHIKDSIDLKRTMVVVIISLIPCLLFGMWNTGYQHFRAIGVEADFMMSFLFGAQKVLPIVVVSYVSGLTVEFVFATLRKHSVNEGFLVSGMLIPLIMPVDVPLWMVAVSTIFAVIFGKEVFGGTGMNIFNPAILARAFLFFAYPKYMSGNKVWINTESADGTPVVDGFTGETPLADAITGGVEAIPTFMESFIGVIPGSIGETSALACLIGAAILIYTGIGSWKIMFSCLLGGIAMAGIFNLLGLNPFMEVPIQNQLVIGSFMFAMVFMATDPVSASQTETGKYIYGFFIGFLGIMIRVFNPAYPEGMMLAILFMNVMAPLIDHYVYEANIKRRLKRVIA